MCELEQQSAESAAAFLLANFGSVALLEASVFGHQALLDNDLERCRFWRTVLSRLEAATAPVKPLS
jgi:hypothetical protein